MGSISGDRDGCEDGKGSGAFKSRKGFGYDIRESQARPNTTIRDLLGNEKFTEAVEMIKEGILKNSLLLSLPLLRSLSSGVFFFVSPPLGQ